jgi:hypothetical protein
MPESVLSIGSDAFSGCSSLETITIPSAVEYIYKKAFAKCESLKEVIAQPTTPPFLSGDAFTNYDITLKVPESALEAYSTTSPWSNFTNIVIMKDDTAPEVKQGDVSGDGEVNSSDLVALIDMMLGKSKMNDAADVNGDGKIDIADIVKLVNIMIYK